MIANPTIYYVDDDKDDLNIFKEALISLGHQPVLFMDGYELLKNLESADPENSMLFVDLNMPRMSGYDVISAVRKSETHSHLPIIAFSTAKDDRSVAKSREAGADMHVQKAINMAGLKKSLQHVLNLPRQGNKVVISSYLYVP